MRIKHLTDIDIQNYLDGDLSTEKQALIVRHLQVCKECQAELKRYEELYKGLSSEIIAELPVNFTMSVISKIQNESSNLFKLKFRDIILSIVGLLVACGSVVYFMDYKMLLEYFVESFTNNFSIDITIIKTFFAKFNLDLNMIVFAGLILLILLLLDNLISRHHKKIISLFNVLPI